MKVSQSVKSILRIEGTWKKLNQKVRMSKLMLMMKTMQALKLKKWRQVMSSWPVSHG